MSKQPRSGKRRTSLQLFGVAAGASMIFAIRRGVARAFEREVARRLPVDEAGIIRGAAPIRLEGSSTHAVLLLHGFNDTPQSVAPLAYSLNERGWTVDAPLLPSHGRTLAIAARANAAEWIAFALERYRILRAQYAVVALVGQSMGGALCALIAAEEPDVNALVLLAPYLGMPRAMQARVWGAWASQLILPYRRSAGGERSIHDRAAHKASLGFGVVSARMLAQLRRIATSAATTLPDLRVPTLYVQSREDNRTTVADAEEHFRRVGSAIKEQHWLTGCGHVIAVDFRRQEVADLTHEWLTRYAGTP